MTEQHTQTTHGDRVPSRLVGAGVVVAIAAASWAIFSRAFLNYDTLYALVWGRDVAHGRLPDYDVTLAPTPHPLAQAIGALASVFGADAGYTIMLALAMLAFGALVWGVFLLGRQCFSWPVGAIAAVVIATRVPFLSYGVRAYLDIPFLALIVFAALIEARTPRRGLPVLVVLGLAGLIRPEAWFISAAYWIYLRPGLDQRERAISAALVVAAPLLWMLGDLVVTGNAIHSLTATRDNSETLSRPRGILNVPEIMPRRLGEILRIVPLAGGAIGFALGLSYLRRRSLIPATLALLGGLGFVAIGVAGLPLLGRYLFLPAAMIAIFFGVACFGWIDIQAPKVRRNWMIGGLALALVFVSSSIAHQTPKLDTLRDGIQYRGAVERDLRDLAGANAEAEQALRNCPVVYVPNHRPVPILAWYVDRAPGDFESAALVRPQRGAWIVPANQRVRDQFVLDPHDPHKIAVPLSAPRPWKLVSSNSSWALYENGC